MIKVEVYVPLRYNNGTAIEPEKIEQVKQDLIVVFGAVTLSSMQAPFEGVWKFGGVEFRDQIILFHVITASDKKTDKFFKSYKETLKERFKQRDILITKQVIQTY